MPIENTTPAVTLMGLSAEWYTAGSTFVLAVVTIVLAWVGLHQFFTIRNEARIARTIGIAEKYDFDPLFDAALRKLRSVYHSGELENNLPLYLLDLTTLLNYFESMLIGIDHNLYDEDILSRQFSEIVYGHYVEYVSSGFADRVKMSAEFDILSKLYARWGSPNCWRTKMISDEQVYKTLSEMCETRNRNAIDAFKLFISLYSAIVGGTIWLSTQAHIVKPETAISYMWLSDAVVVLMTVVAGTLVLEAKRGWWGYRKALAKLGGKSADGTDNIKSPKLFPTILSEIFMVACIVVAGAAFVFFNPLKL